MKPQSTQSEVKVFSPLNNEKLLALFKFEGEKELQSIKKKRIPEILKLPEMHNSHFHTIARIQKIT